MQTKNFHQKSEYVIRNLLHSLTTSVSRTNFCKTLYNELLSVFEFDRMAINLYDSECRMLSYFTSVEGVVIKSLSTIRPADPMQTVAGKVIEERKPVVITDLPGAFPDIIQHPLVEAGLTTTMAFPLMLNDRIFATLHCSFFKQPVDLYAITNFLTEISPAISICLGVILSPQFSSTPFVLQEHGEPPAKVSCSESDLKSNDLKGNFLYYNSSMQTFRKQVVSISKFDIPVLIIGESGTGKSMLAREIHLRSPRHNNAFIKVNCPSLSSTLFESELFGHCKGAFTGAEEKRIGRLEMAQKGTLFLDEIGDLSKDMQSKLLQVLEESTFERVGESVSQKVDVRFIAATNIDIDSAIREGSFRTDLFYRLSGYVLKIPPLRDRKDDIPYLMDKLVSQLSEKYVIPTIPMNILVSREMMKVFKAWDWPGNIRELRNVLLHIMVIYNETKRISVREVDELIRSGATGSEGPSQSSPDTKMSSRLQTLAEMERDHILQALKKSGGKLGGEYGAASLLGINRSTLQHRMKKLGICTTEKPMDELPPML